MHELLVLGAGDLKTIATISLVVVAILAVVIGGLFVIIAKFYRKVDQGKALIVNTMKAEPDVTFTGKVVYPVVHRAEVMDISVKTIDLDRRGKEGLICKDNIRADIKVTFFVRVNNIKEDVLKVAQSIGCQRASDQATLEELFLAKFSEALKTVGKKMDFEELYTKRDDFKDLLIDVIGRDLNGYVLDDAAIDYLEQTPLAQMDPSNILDAQGIRKITEITTNQAVNTNFLKQEERKALTKQNVEADEKVFELQRQRADAEAKQKREIAVVQAREEAEISRVRSEEIQRSELARISAEEEIAVSDQNRQRQVEVASKNKERVVAVETERVEKDRALEQISRERETEIQTIEKQKAIEVEKKAIADIIRERVSVDKTVAEEEEAIKDLRVNREAQRNKDVTIIGAEAAAQESLVKTIKAAEAQKEVASHKKSEMLVLAEADLQTADMHAQAKIRLAEGTQAEEAAKGLGQVRVKEAEAVAIEKTGLAEAKVKLERMLAEAQGAEKQGFAEVAVKEANAAAIEKEGLAEAQVIREKMLAEAAGTEKKGMAEVLVREADAGAIEKQGLAEAVAIRQRLEAQAAGEEAREHEEFRLRLDKEKEVELESIRINRHIAEAQAEILKEAFATAKINIVGGDGQFFERFIKAVSVGQSVDGFVDNSESARKVFQEYLSGERGLPQDLVDVLSRPALGADDLQNLSIAALIGKMMTSADPAMQGKLAKLKAAAAELGLD